MRIPLRAKPANPVLLTAQELRGPRAPAPPWNRDRALLYLKSAPNGFGYWEVGVQREGRYEFVSRLGLPDSPAHLKAGRAHWLIGAVTQEQNFEGVTATSADYGAAEAGGGWKLSSQASARMGRDLPGFRRCTYLGR